MQTLASVHHDGGRVAARRLQSGGLQPGLRLKVWLQRLDTEVLEGR